MATSRDGVADARALTELRFGESLRHDPLEKLRFSMILYARLHNSSWLEVPETFVVPESWPEPVRGLELGKAVASLRRLEAAATSTTRRKKSVTSAESGMELGRDATAPRPSRTRWGRLLTRDTGFDWGELPVGEQYYEALVTCLEAYLGEHGDLVLPRSYRIPNRPPFPPEMAGMDLDRAVYCLSFYRTYVAGCPDRQARLRALGFVWQRLQPEYNLVFEALVSYKARHGDLLVPSDFVVPTPDVDDDWPLGAAGMPLGRRVRQIRGRHDYLGPSGDGKWQALDALGFVWDYREYKRAVFHEALERYVMVTSDPPALLDFMPRVDEDAPPPEAPPDESVDWTTVNVPLDFVVPTSGPQADKYPKRCRGLKLGYKVAEARRKQQSGARQDAFDDLLDALKSYVAVYGNADVPQKFVVPTDAAWPVYTHGFPLGTRVAHVRSKGTSVGGKTPLGDLKRLYVDRRKDLDDLGFIWAKRSPKSKRRRDPPKR